MALHLLEATLTQGPSCSADDIAELEIHIRNEIERYVQYEIERELYELVQPIDDETLLSASVCSTYLAGSDLNHDSIKKRIKTDSETMKTSAKTSMDLDQQLTELKNKYLAKIAGPLSTFEALKLISDKQTEENQLLEKNLNKLKQLYKEYYQYDQHSTEMLEHSEVLNQTQSAVSNQNNPTEESTGDSADQFESLSTLIFHKIFNLPLIDMKKKHLRKPEKALN